MAVQPAPRCTSSNAPVETHAETARPNNLDLQKTSENVAALAARPDNADGAGLRPKSRLWAGKNVGNVGSAPRFSVACFSKTMHGLNDYRGSIYAPARLCHATVTKYQYYSPLGPTQLRQHPNPWGCRPTPSTRLFLRKSLQQPPQAHRFCMHAQRSQQGARTVPASAAPSNPPPPRHCKRKRSHVQKAERRKEERERVNSVQKQRRARQAPTTTT